MPIRIAISTASVHLSLLNFLLLATKRGILVKDGRSLELLSQVDTPDL